MSEITAAVVGTGFIGPVHVEGLQRAGVRVKGILGSSLEKSRRVAEELGLPKAYENLEEVLADSDVDVVHLTTPNRFHYPQAKQVLLAGKHVLCEKPLALTSDESADLVRLAQETGLVAGVNYNIRYYPLCVEARARVRAGKIGEIYAVTGSYVHDWLLYPTDYNWRVLASEGGSLRAVADIGTHWIDLVTAITGLEVEAVCADLHTVHPIRYRPVGEVETFKAKEETTPGTRVVEISTEDQGAVLLRFSGGVRGVLWVSQVTAGRKNCLRYEIAGANGALAWCSEQPNELWIGRRDRPNEVLLRDPALVGDEARATISYPGGHNEGFGDTFKHCFRAFYSYIEAGDFSATPTFPTFADGHREVVICEAILRSHQEGGWVSVDEISSGERTD